jgi:excisionase family DNA binding protein
MRETMRNMTALRLPDAARRVGLHRSSLFRAIRSGRLSATRTEGGDFLIDASELFRVYPPKNKGPQGTHPDASDASGCVEPRAPAHETTINELRLRLTALEAELCAQRELVSRLDQDKADLMRQRDGWQGQAERLALAPPSKRSWWSWRKG